jgi:hypothetical protein
VSPVKPWRKPPNPASRSSSRAQVDRLYRTRQVLPQRKPATGSKSNSSIKPANQFLASLTRSNFPMVPPRRETLMQMAKQESTASTPAIAKSRFQILTRSLGAKNNFLLRVRTLCLKEMNRVIDL